MIRPTVGRVVWYRINASDPAEWRGYHNDVVLLAAIVCWVWSDTVINLAIFSPDGKVFAKTSVVLTQEDTIPPGCAGWMPYQKGQAAKADELAARLRDEPPPG
jgi:hypothetical protein